MAEIGILWVAVAYCTRKIRAGLRLKFNRKNAPMKELTAAPAHLPMKAGEADLADWHHRMVAEHRTGEYVIVKDDSPDWTLPLMLEPWMPVHADESAGTPILDSVSHLEPDPIDLEWLSFTSSWPLIKTDQLVGASS